MTQKMLLIASSILSSTQLQALKIFNATDEPMSITMAQEGEDKKARIIRPQESLMIPISSPKTITFTITGLDTNLHRDCTVHSNDKLKITIKDDKIKLHGSTAHERKKKQAAEMEGAGN